MTLPEVKPVAVVGLTVVDRLYRLQSFPTSPGKYFSDSCEEVIGGIAANASLTIRRLGADARLVSRLGDDPSGAWLLSALDGQLVDTSNIKVIADSESPSSSILIDASGERIIVNHKPVSLFSDDVVIDTEKLSGVGAVLADLRWSSGAEGVLRWASRNLIPAVLDYDQAPENDAESLLDLATHVVFAEKALRELTGESDLEHALLASRRMCPHAEVAVTAGSAGVRLLRNTDEVVHIPARKVRITHTVGAGDVFHGAVAYALAQGMSFVDSLTLANDAAALKISSPSGAWKLPTLQDITTFQENYTPCH